jgi:VanZ family protein
MSPNLYRLLLWSALLFAFAMALHPRPPAVPTDPPDKVQHFVAFLTLGLLAARAYPAASLLAIAAGLAAAGALIEIIQLIPALNRSGSFLDWVADLSGIAAALAVTALFRRSRRRFRDSQKLC